MAITLTKSAADRIASQLQKNAAIGLRFAANESGCSGYSYVMDYTDKKQQDDQVFTSHGVDVLIDPDSYKLLKGTQIDYVTEGLNQSFRFSNPKAEAHCGCGESFAMQADQ